MTKEEFKRAFDKYFRAVSFPYKNESEKNLIKRITIAAYESVEKAAK